jgi:hypothetical protein
MKVTLDFPEAFWRGIELAAKELRIEPSTFVTNVVIDAVARESTYLLKHGKPDPLAHLKFIPDGQGGYTTGDELFSFLLAIYSQAVMEPELPEEPVGLIN